MTLHCSRCGVTLEGASYVAEICPIIVDGESLAKGTKKGSIYYCRDCLGCFK